MKKTFGLAAAAMLALSLSACGDDGGGDGGSGGEFDEAAYCDAYESAKSELDNLDPTQLDGESFDDLKNRISDMRDQAPPELEDDWQTVGGALEEFESILERAGLSIDDLSSIQAGEIPENLDMSKIQDLQTDMQEFADNQDFENAGDAIKKDAEQRCDIPTEGGES